MISLFRRWTENAWGEPWGAGVSLNVNGIMAELLLTGRFRSKRCSVVP